MTRSDAGDIRTHLKNNTEISDPDVVALSGRDSYYVVGEGSADLPVVDGFDPIDDPSL